MKGAPAADPVNLRMRDRLASWRDPVADEMARWIPAGTPVQEILYGPIREHALRPGKGLRPAICLETCRAFGGNVEAALPTAAVLELFHNAFLVHDDVEDGSALRRQEPSLHAVYGVPIAVNAGDAMLALALPPLIENTRALGLGKALRVLQVIADMARETAEGQAIELDWIRRGAVPSDDAYVEMVSLKTASYSFVAPMTLGALVGGAPADCMGPLARFAREVGVAFQIRDDVLNLRPAALHWGKDALDDLWEGKRTLLLCHALREASAADRAEALAILARARPAAGSPDPHAVLDRLVRDGALSPEARRALDRDLLGAMGVRPTKSSRDVEFLLGLVVAAGSIGHAEAVAARHAEAAAEAFAACEAWIPPSEARDFLYDLVEFVRSRGH